MANCECRSVLHPTVVVCYSCPLLFQVPINFVRKLHNLSARAIVKEMKTLAAGKPIWLRDCDINPHYPRGHGFVERQVQTVKKTILKCKEAKDTQGPGHLCTRSRKKDVESCQSYRPERYTFALRLCKLKPGLCSKGIGSTSYHTTGPIL